MQPPPLVLNILEQHADEATTYADVAILLLPFFRKSRELRDTVQTLSQLGARVIPMKQGQDGCPRLHQRMDAEFQRELTTAVVDCIYRLWPANIVRLNLFSNSTEYQVAFDLLRGLASHYKMGPNNHSHEDDMWKGCGIGLQPSARRVIEKRLMAEGILERKKNRSQGGTGWVYWIADVKRMISEFPALRDIIGDTGERAN